MAVAASGQDVIDATFQSKVQDHDRQELAVLSPALRAVLKDWKKLWMGGGRCRVFGVP